MSAKKPKLRFNTTPLHKRREPAAILYLTQKSSFWIATFSLVAFLVGNMVGQHGWYAFWASVLGKEGELITYTGTVSPIEHVPDYVTWAQYGGNPHEHTFRQVPSTALVTLPQYVPSRQNDHMKLSTIGQIYSVGYNGSYATGGDNDGSHPGIDIRIPIGTPVRSIANGIVTVSKYDAGFGNVVVVKHPNVPDPENPRKLTTLHSVYAHLNASYKEVGDIVRKGEQIGVSGNTGFASGPHLHFQIDRDEAPWHPYWPFTSSEAAERGLNLYQAVNEGLNRHNVVRYTVNPMLYVQADHAPVTQIVDATEERDRNVLSTGLIDPVVSRQTSSVRVAPSTLSSAEYILARSRERRQERLARRRERQNVNPPVEVVHTSAPVSSSSSSAHDLQASPTSSAPGTSSVETVVKRIELATSDIDDVGEAPSQKVSEIELDHDGSFDGREWETLRVTLKDEGGNAVLNPELEDSIYLRTAYGTAEFVPDRLFAKDFINGVALVRVLPRGRRTVVIEAKPQGVISKPMQYMRTR